MGVGHAGDCLGVEGGLVVGRLLGWRTKSPMARMYGRSVRCCAPRDEAPFDDEDVLFLGGGVLAVGRAAGRAGRVSGSRRELPFK